MAKGDIISRLRLESGEFDSKIKRAGQELLAYSQHCRKTGLEMGFANRDAKEFAKSLGSMQVTATTARGKVSELSDAFVNLKAMYNQMTDAEKQGQFGKNLAASLDQLKQRTQEAKEELASITKELQGSMSVGNAGGLFGGSKLDGMLQVFGGNLMTKGAGMLAGLASEMGDMIKQGIELAKQGEGIRNAFERLNDPNLLNGLREATHGTVTDIELMKAAVKFNDFKLPLDQLGTMLEFAQKKAKDTGQSVDYMVDSIVTGLGRKSLMILDNLGLSAAEIKDKMQETGDMTKAVGAIIREQMSKAGDYVETAADRAAQADVQMKNALEELGRTFQPIGEAGVNMFNRMAIGAINALNKMRPFFDMFTEAGRIRQDKESQGGSSKVNNQLTILRGTNSKYQSSRYDRTVAEYEKQISDINKSIAGYRFTGSNDAISRNNVKRLEEQRTAIQQLLNEYKAGAKEIMKPAEVNLDTKKAEQNASSLRKQLADLEKQRRDAVKSGDQGKVKTLTQQINQTKTSIRALDPQALKTTTTHKVTPQERASDKVEEAERTYAETLQKNAIRMEVGLDTTLENKKKELSAQERLFDAYNDAYAIYKDPKYKDAAEASAEKLKSLGGEVKTATEAQKLLDEQARKNAAAWKKLEESSIALYKAQDNNDLRAFYKAREQYKAAGGGNQIGPSVFEGGFTATTANIDAFIANLKQRISESDIGSDLNTALTAQMADATTLANVIQVAIKNGIDVTQFEPQTLWQKIFGENPGDYIDDTVWQSMVDTINEKLAEMHIDPIKIEFKTGEVKSQAKEMSKDWQAAGSAIQAVGAAMQQIEDPAAKVMGTIAQAVASVALGASQAIAQASNGSAGGPWGWIAFAAAATATMIGTIASIHNATGYANGGIVDGRAGGFVGGTAYSGDNVGNVRLDSGELVLNRSQQNNLADQLDGGAMQGMFLESYITAEDIRLVLNNNGRRTGRGEYVQSRNRR